MLRYAVIDKILNDYDHKKLEDMIEQFEPGVWVLNHDSGVDEIEYQQLHYFLTRITMPNYVNQDSPVILPYHAHALHEIIVANKKNPNSLYFRHPALIELAEDIEAMVDAHPDLSKADAPDLLSQLILACADDEMLDNEVISALLDRKLSGQVADLLQLLSISNLLTKDLLLFVIKHSDPAKLCRYLDNLDGVYHGKNKENVAKIILILLENDVACGDYDIYELLALPRPLEVVGAIVLLSGANCLTAELFDKVIQLAYIFDVTQVTAWDWLPNEHFNADVMLRALQIAELANGDKQAAWQHIQFELEQYIPADQFEAPPEQTTHTFSVHQTTSESAKRLWVLYGHMINDHYKLDAYLRRIDGWLKRLPESSALDDKVVAAKRAFNEIKKSSFIDPASGVSLPRLLALAWIALRDHRYQAKFFLTNKNELLIGEQVGGLFLGAPTCSQQYIKQVFMPLLMALYECQRGNNIDAKTEVDDGREDQYICLPGRFNKIIEKLVGINDAVELKFIKHEHAQERLWKVIDEVVASHLQKLSFAEIKELIALHDAKLNDEDHDMSPTSCDKAIWHAIKDKVTAMMVREGYPSAYATIERFHEVVGQGLYRIDAAALLAPYRVANVASVASLSLFGSSSSVARTEGPSEDKENELSNRPQ